jgi:alpha-galactosidase
LAARRDQAKALVSPPLRLSGLDPSRRYRISLIRPWPDPAWRFLPDAGAWRASVEASGALLMQVGMRLPLIHPETAWLVHLKAVEEHSS